MPRKRAQGRGGSALAYRRGQRPVLVSAPHQYPHWRHDRFKLAETHSGPIARNVARRTACHSLVTRGSQRHDPNYDEFCPFKDKLADINAVNPLAFVLDLHGAAPHRDFAFALGTNDGTTVLGRQDLVDSLVSALSPVAGRMKILVNPPDKFGARHPYTISRYCAEHLDVPAIQLEVNMRLEDRWHEIADCLTAFVRTNFPNER